MATKEFWLGSIGPFRYDDALDSSERVPRFADLSAGILGGLSSAVRSVATDTTMLAVEGALFVDASGGPKTVYFPSAVTNEGREFIVKKVDSSANAVTLDPNGAETIDGETTVDLELEDESLTIKSDGANWQVV